MDVNAYISSAARHVESARQAPDLATVAEHLREAVQDLVFAVHASLPADSATEPTPLDSSVL